MLLQLQFKAVTSIETACGCVSKIAEPLMSNHAPMAEQFVSHKIGAKMSTPLFLATPPMQLSVSRIFLKATSRCSDIPAHLFDAGTQ